MNAAEETPPIYRLLPRGLANWPAQSPRLSQALGFFLFEIAFYFAYRYGMSFSPACASPFWFPDSVLLCALLLTRPRYWWAFVLGTLPIRLFSSGSDGIPGWFLLVTFAIDAIKGLLIAGALRRFIGKTVRLQTLKEFAIFCFFAVLLVPAASAFAGAAARQALGNDYWTTWEQWFMGDALAQLVLTPAILYGSRRWPWARGPTWSKRTFEAALLAVGLVVTCHLAFDMGTAAFSFSEPHFYAPVPLMFWAAIRFGMFGASGAIAIITCFSVAAAVHHRGSFFGLSPADAALALQHFLLLRAAPLYLVAILIEQKQHTESSLRESEQRFRIIADTAPVLLWMSGTNKLCEFFNRGWLEFTGRTLKQELGNGWTEAVHPDDLQHCLEVYSSHFDARQSFEMEYRLRRFDGEYRWVLDRGVPRYASNGDFVGYVGTALDITDRKRVEETTQELVHASRLVVVGEFTAMIAHELSKPLGAILANAEAAKNLLSDQNTPLPVDILREIVADIHRDDLRAREIIHRLHSLLRKREMQIRPVDINKIVTEILRFVKGDANRRGVQIFKHCRVPLPAVQGDPVHLQQVLLNLILNAMDAMNDNPESDRELVLSTERTDDGFVEVAVRDLGHGIAPENMARIFESFFTTKSEGMGIGLSIARSIIQMHAGRLWAENNQGSKGTTFRFTVPIVPASNRHQVTKSPVMQGAARTSRPKRFERIFKGQPQV
jgi:PAS domain S-box-containing protein